MIKKLSLVVALLVVLVGAWHCTKSESSCNPVSPETEDPAMVQYMTEHNINGVKDPSGLYYEILEPGSGSSPVISSKVAVTYSGWLTNGTKFDEMLTPVSNIEQGWLLGGLIEGWQIGLQKIKKGGKIKMVIPSALAYGCVGSSPTIPPNAILVFDVTLVDFK